VNKKDANGRSALSFAAGYGYLDVVKLLLNTKGVDIESKDNDGGTPLSHATRYPDIVKVLQRA
jgi:ankyrin repeat protein